MAGGVVAPAVEQETRRYQDVETSVLHDEKRTHAGVGMSPHMPRQLHPEAWPAYHPFKSVDLEVHHGLQIRLRDARPMDDSGGYEERFGSRVHQAPDGHVLDLLLPGHGNGTIKGESVSQEFDQ